MSTITESMPRRPQRLLGAAAAAVLATAVVVAAVLLLTSGSGSGSSAAAHREAQYGGIPKWLPKTEDTEERIVTAAPHKPALAIQGNTVAVDLSGGHKVLATVVGPEVPEEGQFPVPATSPATFVLTFAKGSTAVPIVPADFTVVDDQGHLHHPELTGMNGGPPPTEVPAGRTVSLKLRGVFPTGDGSVEWSPGTSKPFVAWDFDIEID